MSEPRPVFTVFTATYNRAHLLGDVYQALVAQSFTDFEWLIIDDGSTDYTHELVAKWKSENRLAIRYYYQRNGGPHTAHNRALGYARGDLFLRHDSDDVCKSTALERFYSHWRAIDQRRINEFSGVSCLYQNESGEIYGDLFPADAWEGHSIELLGLRGDKWGFHRTEVLREYPFPEFRNEKFVPEGLIWNRIGSHYKTLCVNEPLSVCRPSTDSITRRIASIRNQCPQGTMLYYSELLQLPINAKVATRGAANYIRFSLGAGRPFWRSVISAPRKGLAALAAPLGAYLYLRDRFWCQRL